MQEKIDNGEYRSLPARERGLKLIGWCRICGSRIVAPCAGAWIEIGEPAKYYNPQLSLPARERGLKCLLLRSLRRSPKSLPARERGLK